MTRITCVTLAALGLAAAAPAQKSKEPAAPPPAESRSPTNSEARPAAPPPTATTATGERKQSLDDLLARALQQSPDVQLAEAKVREAEAMLRQARLGVAQKLVETHGMLDQHSRMLGLAEQQFLQVKKQYDAGLTSASERSSAEAKLLAAKAQVAQLEATVRGLSGQMPIAVMGHALPGAGMAGAGFGSTQAGTTGATAAPAGVRGDGLTETGARPPRPAMAQRMLQALDAPLPKIDAPVRDVPLKDVVARVRKLAPDVPIMAQLGGAGDQPVTIDFEGGVTLGGLFQMLGDAVPDLNVYVRDYGFLITIDNAPTDGMRIAEFQATANKNR